MDNFTPLERKALDAILAEMAEGRTVVECQLLHAMVLTRENTGSGFFVDLQVAPGVERFSSTTMPLGQNVWVGIDGLEYGLGAILHFRDGRVSLLEGYAVSAEDTSSIDFAHVRFVISREPGPFPSPP